MIGFEEVVENVTKESILEYFNSRYVPENMTLIIVGDFENKIMKKDVESYFNSFIVRSLKSKKRAEEALQKAPRVSSSKSIFEETIMHISWPVPNVSSADIPALEVLSMVLGSGDSCRLMRALRIEKPITNYTVSSTFIAINKGLFVVSSSMNAAKLDESLDEILNQLLLILREPPTSDEIEKVQLNYESEEFFNLETVEGLAGKYGTYNQFFDDCMYYETFLKQVLSLKPEDIHRVAKKYLKPEKMNVTILSMETEESTKKTLDQFCQNYKKTYDLAVKNKNAPRKDAKIKKIKWPKPKSGDRPILSKSKLSKGSYIITRSSQESPIVSVRCAFLGGLRVEDKVKNGTNELLSRVWAAGSVNFTEQEIHEKTESLASGIAAFGGRNTAGLNLTTFSVFLEETMEIFVDILCRPLLSPESIAREKIYSYHPQSP